MSDGVERGNIECAHGFYDSSRCGTCHPELLTDGWEDMANPEWDNYNPSKCKRCDGTGNEPRQTETPERPAEKDELDERLRLFANAWMSAAVAKSGPAISHWGDKIDEHHRAIRELFAASVISSASPLSEDERQRISEVRARVLAAKMQGYQWGVQQEAVSDLAFSLAIIARLSASAPSPEDKGSDNG